MNGTAVGIVIDVGAVEAAEVARDGADVRVRRTAREALPESAWSGGAVSDFTAVAAAVRRLLRDRKSVV